jgi:hypothetical protein
MLKLRAAAMAALLGTSVLGVGAALAPAQAAVSPAVGNPLKEAISLANSGKYREAMERVNAAAAAAKTADEHKAVDGTKNFIAGKSGDTSTAVGAQTKFANDANAGRWKDVIEDEAALRKTGTLTAQAQTVIAQAYYMLHDAKGCMGFIKRQGLGGETALSLLQRCAYDANDEATQRQALEQLVTSTGKAEHWKNLLKLSERAKGISDHSTLDIFRLKSMTGTLDNAEVTQYATFALQMRMPQEGKAVLTKAIADKTVNADDRTNRLLKLATDRANEDSANFGKNLAAAQKAKEGDDLVRMGEDQIGMGKAKEAVDTIKAGIAKGCKDAANCQLRLGTAYLAAGQKADAVKAFNAVKGDDKIVMIAHLYSLYARR